MTFTFPSANCLKGERGKKVWQLFPSCTEEQLVHARDSRGEREAKLSITSEHQFLPS